MTIEESNDNTLVKQVGVEWSTDSVIFPEKLVQSVVASTNDFAVVQQDPFRVILVGASHPSKDDILGLLSSAINSKNQETTTSHRQVLEADFTSSQEQDLDDYLERIIEKRIDLVIYLCDPSNDKAFPVFSDRTDTVVWPLVLDEASFATSQDLATHLARYLANISIMDMRDDKEELLPHAISIKEFLAMSPSSVYDMLKHCPRKRLSPIQEEPVVLETNKEVVTQQHERSIHGNNQAAAVKKSSGGMSISGSLLGLLAVAVIGVAWKTLHHSSSLKTLNLTAPHPPMGLRLNPMWDAVDPETLEHLFVVELDAHQPGSWHDQHLTVTVQGGGDELVYPMTYEPGTAFHYSALVPSPCLLDRNNDLDAHVVWRYDHDDETLGMVEKVIDTVVLSTKSCQPAHERKKHVTDNEKEKEQQDPMDDTEANKEKPAVVHKPKNTVAIVPSALPFQVVWKTIMDNLKSRTQNVARVVATFWQSFAHYWQ
ncbi:hypothetical protein K492DRAFT_234563 [Lichtheimia hyalospora FSU 10163]|nr:hypothetical protein K492DRAFT_234563 [Lichtheimia hyalospora FSU 10163]